MNRRLFAPAAIGAVAALTLTGCVSNNPDGDAKAAGGDGGNKPIGVTITDDSCEVPVGEVPQGQVSFSLSNEGTVRNEFEVLAEDKLRIVGERENLGPGTKTDYTLVLEPGTYYTACKKNMVGSLVDVREFTVTNEGEAPEISADKQKVIDDAVTNYTAYVKDQTGQLLAATRKFADAYTSGDTDQAKELYAPGRMYYERIEPTAEAFGDIDPAIDEREADYQADDDKGGRDWTGWHVIEKDLWRPEGDKGLSAEEQKKYADKLVEDTQKLYDLVYSPDFTVSIDDISNGAIALLEEVATTKITGEEEAFSHTDLYDFQANLEGAQVAYGNVKPLAERSDPELAKTIDARIESLQAELDKYREGDGFKSYADVTEPERRALADQVDALRVPLAKLTEAVIQ